MLEEFESCNRSCEDRPSHSKIERAFIMKPIITSLLDLDQYKISMGNAVFLKHPNVQVTYAFKNRTKAVDLGNWISPYDLQKQIDYVMGLRFTDDELTWLQKNNNYSDEYIKALKDIKLVEPNVIIDDRMFKGVEISGNWFNSILWETILLSIINQLFNAKYMKAYGADYNLFDDDMFLLGVSRLEEKIELLKQYPQIQFLDFGTRRRFSSKWQEYVIKRLKQEIPNQLLGTSNVHYAMKYGLKAMGSIAHEMSMVYSILYNENLALAQNTLLDDWYELYGGPGSIALTDTYGTDFFFQNISMKHLINYWGARIDSGDPVIIGEKALKYYRDAGIDPMGKMILFSDGLTVPKMVELYKYFSPYTKVGFGVGTSLTNDLGGRPLSIVIKAVEAEGRGLCKLSDNIEKCMGTPEDIERYKQLVGYTSQFREVPIY